MSGSKPIPLIGRRFGRLVVIARANIGENHIRWRCRCDCGNETTVLGMSLRKAGGTKSCGCISLEICARRTREKKPKAKETKAYYTWKSMRRRCFDPKYPKWVNYGGRGITVCQRWLVFSNFLADMGDPPGPEYSIDRIDNDGNYEPDNCRWATRIEQRRNRRDSRFLIFNTTRVSVAELCEQFGIVYSRVNSRANRARIPHGDAFLWCLARDRELTVEAARQLVEKARPEALK